MESNDTRLARIAEFEANVAAHQESVLTPAEWEELNLFEGGGLGCKVGCLAEYVSCMQGCSGLGCVICQTYLQQCFNGCNQQ
jgi:hypothetical protein